MYRSLFVFILAFSPMMGVAQENAAEIEKLRKEIQEQKAKLDEQQRTLDRLAGKKQTPDGIPGTRPAPAAVSSRSDYEDERIAPLSFRIGGADFTPGGFLDLSSVWRSTNVGSGVATSFGAIPANDSSAGKLSEWRFSAYNSRVTLKVSERPLANVRATGYLEVDFAGALPANAYVTGNSVTFRLRQGWVNVQAGKFEVLGGQAWTLMTPNRIGTSPVPSEIFIGLGQDSAYVAGLAFVRQSQVRATYHITPQWTAAFSVENPQQYVTSATTLPATFISQFDTPAGNSAIANARPDFAAKLAYDGKLGARPVHVEIAGISRQFRTLTSDNVSHTAQGLGGSTTVVIEPVRNFRWILTTFFSSGGGRYIMGMGPDVVVGPDGSISPVHTVSGITGIEFQIRPTSQVYAYYSGVYFNRNYMPASAGGYFGFGYPGSSSAANRQIQEATAGYAHTFWRNPNFGAFQALGQYAFVTRSPWSRPAVGGADFHTHMVFAGLRFTLP